MDGDDLPLSTRNPLSLLADQDLTPFSRDELAARITALEAEIARTRLHLARAGETRSTAENLFRRPGA